MIIYLKQHFSNSAVLVWFGDSWSNTKNNWFQIWLNWDSKIHFRKFLFFSFILLCIYICEQRNILPGTTSKMGVSANDGQSALILTPVKSWFVCNQTRNCHMHSDSMKFKNASVQDEQCSYRVYHSPNDNNLFIIYYLLSLWGLSKFKTLPLPPKTTEMLICCE